MRVATLFTGAAAVTVGMAPVANAQDVAHATVHRPASKHIARQMRPATQTNFGNIKSVFACALLDVGHPVTNPTWLHADWYNVSEEISESMCYGFSGWIVSPPGVGVTYECGGNNYGQLRGYSKGHSWYFDFGPGTTYAHLNRASMDVVSIWSWKGTDKCGRHL
jgi:hypothetical protein